MEQTLCVLLNVFWRATNKKTKRSTRQKKHRMFHQHFSRVVMRMTSLMELAVEIMLFLYSPSSLHWIGCTRLHVYKCAIWIISSISPYLVSFASGLHMRIWHKNCFFLPFIMVCVHFSTFGQYTSINVKIVPISRHTHTRQPAVAIQFRKLSAANVCGSTLPKHNDR